MMRRLFGNYRRLKVADPAQRFAVNLKCLDPAIFKPFSAALAL
jgi:hypothetical protein